MQSSVAPSSAQSDIDNSNDTNGDVWLELFGIVSGLEQTVDLAMQAFGTSDTVNDFNKVMSATTKKRLLIKSVQGFKESRVGLGSLTNHLRALQVASQQWQRSMLFASKSQEDLMDHLEGTSQQLHETSERLRASEAGRIMASRQEQHPLNQPSS